MGRSVKVFFPHIAFALSLAASAQVEASAPSDMGLQAALAFQNTCLATRTKGSDAAVASILSRPNAKEGPNLPAYGGGKPMRTFSDGKFEYLVRFGKSGAYGCFVALNGDVDLAGSVKASIDALAGLQAKPVKNGKKVFYEWTIIGSKDEIRLTPKSNIGAILINLEVIS